VDLDMMEVLLLPRILLNYPLVVGLLTIGFELLIATDDCLRISRPGLLSVLGGYGYVLDFTAIPTLDLTG
jgi:hypothetical protein